MKIGYARVSTPDQNPALQLEALEKAGCEKIYQEKKSAFKERPELIRALEDLRTGGYLICLVVGSFRQIHEGNPDECRSNNE